MFNLKERTRMKKEDYLRPEARCFALMTECGLLAGSDNDLVVTDPSTTTFPNGPSDSDTPDGEEDDLVVTTEQ
jgi:hypothetical protein